MPRPGGRHLTSLVMYLFLLLESDLLLPGSGVNTCGCVRCGSDYAGKPLCLKTSNGPGMTKCLSHGTSTGFKHEADSGSPLNIHTHPTGSPKLNTFPHSIALLIGSLVPARMVALACESGAGEAYFSWALHRSLERVTGNNASRGQVGGAVPACAPCFRVQ